MDEQKRRQTAERYVRKVLIDIFEQNPSEEKIQEIADRVLRATPKVQAPERETEACCQ